MTAKNDKLTVASGTVDMSHGNIKHEGRFAIVDKYPNNRINVYGELEGTHKGNVCWPRPGARCQPAVVSFFDGNEDTAFKDKSFSQTVTIRLNKNHGQYGQPGIGKVTTRARVCEATAWYWHACSGWKGWES